MKQHALRLPDDLFDAATDRAQRHGLSRNEWFVKAIRYVLEQPSRVRTSEVKERF